MNSRILRSRHLEMRPLGEDDLDELHELFVHPEIRRYLWDDEIVPRAVAADVVAKSKALFLEKRFGLWGVREQEQRRLIGFAGFWYFFEPPELQLLVGLHPHVWGRGFGTEVIRRMIREGFDELGMTRIVAATDVPNQASVRVMERAGMSEIGRVAGPKWENVRYAIDKKPAGGSN